MRIEARLETHPQADRRGSPRRELHLRLDSLGDNSEPANVLVLDLSRSGMLLRTGAKLAPGDDLQIDLPEAGVRPATVMWTSGDFVGCRFAEPISSAALSAALLRSQPASADPSADEPAAADTEPFGVRLRRLRQRYNLSQTAVAKLVNVNKLSVWKWERGDARPRPSAIEALAKVFAVSENELLMGIPAAVETAQESDPLSALIDDCKARIAAQIGISTDQVEIAVKL